MPNHAHQHYVGSTVSSTGQVIVLTRACAVAGRRAHQSFGPLNRVVLTDDFWLSEEVMDAANHAWDRQEKEAIRVAAHEARCAEDVPLF